MNKERELLRRISSHSGTTMDTHFIYELQELLAQPETAQEPVAWMYEWTNEKGEIAKGVFFGSHKASHLYGLANLEPLYTAPPKREPLSNEERWEGFPHGVYTTCIHTITGVNDE